MKKNIIVLVMSIFILAILLVGCGKSNEEKQGKTIGLIVSTLDNPFFVDLKNGVEEEAAKHGLNLVILDSQNDPARELANMENLLIQNPKVILINPTDSSAVVNAIRLANNKNIPIITLDRGSEAGNVATHVASDNIAGGNLAGQYIVEMLGNSGKVVELEGIAGTNAARDRGKGFNDILKNSSIEIIARQVADFDRIKGLSVMENILQAQSEINAVFAHNDEMALGALRAIESSNRNIMIVGFDATNDAIKAVKDGKMAATVAQQPKIIGKLGINASLKILAGEPIDKFIPVPLELITR